MVSRARDYLPGEHVPGTVYEVLRLIGAGGMGTVYDVEDTTIGKRYVLKTLHAQLGAREDLARRMQSEARTLARLHHPNIVDVITAGVTGDDLKLPYYVMERLDGHSLRYVLDKGGQLELPHAYHIAIDLLDALDHAHDKGVIHRDVKPDNIFLHKTAAGMTVTKLLDFGILSLLDSTHSETAGRFLGTLRYAAPEQLRGEKPTPKVDIYAAALVLYEMIAGRGPFDDEGDPHKVAAAHLHKAAPPLSSFVVIPKELDALVSASLAKLPAQRPRDAFSLAASLRNLKKALAGSGSQDSTENRATAAALVASDRPAAPFVHVQQPLPDGPFVISPAVGERPPPSTPPMGGPHTTMRGMPSPSMGPSLAQPGASLGPTATSPQSVDRRAPTHSFVPDASPAPRQDTHVGVASVEGTLASNAPPPVAAVDFRWPPEPPVARSEEPQVRTLSVQMPTVPRSVAPVVAAVLLMVALAVAFVGLVVLRMRASSSSDAAPPRPVLAVSSAAPPAPQPVVAIPAPTLAPPALDDPPTASVAPSGRAAAAVVPSASSRPGPKAVFARTPTTAAPVAAPARPGPGF